MITKYKKVIKYKYSKLDSGDYVVDSVGAYFRLWLYSGFLFLFLPFAFIFWFNEREVYYKELKSQSQDKKQ